MRTNISQSCWFYNRFGLVLVGYLIFVSYARCQATGGALSADETVSYINKQLAAYPNTWFAHRCAESISISQNRRQIFVDWISCEKNPHFSIDVLQLSSGTDVHGEPSSIDTGATRTSNGDHSTVVFLGGGMTWYGNTAPLYEYDGATWGQYVPLHLTAPNEIALRVGRAVNHLAATLKSEAAARIPANDPFAKHQ